MAAQKRDKEETELKVSENLHICTAATKTTATAPHTQTPPSRSPGRSDPTAPALYEARISSATSPEKPDLVPTAENRASLKRPRDVSRCSGSGCRKRIGLVGFRCRCGDTFCSVHRYSDRHDCSFDYKAAGRESIARENPVVRAAKLLKV